MLVLGIETSCDETAVAITDKREILANCVSSSVHLHSEFGGVIPEIASRYHVEYINYVLKEALEKAHCDLSHIDLTAVTVKPGLVGALLVGISLAKAISFSLKIPLIGIDHLAAHLYAVFMDGANVRLPYIGMVVSGGHTSIFKVEDIGRLELLGQTIDDACGEAFDKVAKMLNLGYPGGPIIQKRALTGTVIPGLFPIDRNDDSLDFSFSGIKTSVLYHLRDRLRTLGILKGNDALKAREISKFVHKLSYVEISNIAASFQDAATTTLCEKAVAACVKTKIKRLVLGGGVSANKELRKKINLAAQRYGIEFFVPKRILCLDNAAMVAGLGEALFKKGYKSNLTITAQSITSYKSRGVK